MNDVNHEQDVLDYIKLLLKSLKCEEDKLDLLEAITQNLSELECEINTN